MERIDRLEKWQSELKVEQLLDHEGLFAVSGEGLRGGGPLTSTVGFAIDFSRLDVEEPRSDAFFPYWDQGEGLHQTVSFSALQNLLVKSLGIRDLAEKVGGLSFELKQLKEDFKKLGVYSTLPQREKIVGEVEREATKLVEDASKIEAATKDELSKTTKDVISREASLKQREDELTSRERNARLFAASLTEKSDALEREAERLRLKELDVQKEAASLRERLAKLKEIVDAR